MGTACTDNKSLTDGESTDAAPMGRAVSKPKSCNVLKVC